MKAIVQDRYGSPDVLRLCDVDTPTPGNGEVLVRVHASSVNAYDWHAMRGDPYLARLSFGLRRPRAAVRGQDFAGRVEAVGPGVTRWRPGDEVYGEAGPAGGAFAEYLCVAENLVEAKPVNLSFEQAAAIPLAATTALICLRDAADLRAGQHVLINGASGGVGTFAVQLAKAFGAQVTAVCRTRNVELVRSLGADHVVDYTREDFTRTDVVRAGRRYDVLLDLVGNRSLAGCRRVLTPDGTLLLSGGGVFTGGSVFGPMSLLVRGPLVGRFVRHRIVSPSATAGRGHLAALRELAEAGKLTPAIDRTFQLSEAADAIRYVETEHARAKVVVTVSGSNR
ncbi:NAD(P)-dependent alcohol dehydrogenase [Micromonospora sp. NBC_01813]|uniref:NAD(P)-dependent alcohol dehydrogenase n=1 Tax=Micromonospora sp. NBC_01813 TaxID=2975988 RepID=UPI002DDA96B9|nr:NAD(P)-dependent alcohol dehydrogenase [Micromonospora sp. NBC_01813]WSA06182.1 NAD(P)-dependent alcohol dehydrogenase [Micromonospora sp. NBC_01813]